MIHVIAPSPNATPDGRVRAADQPHTGRRTERPTETTVAERVRARPPRRYAVVLHNDDFTTMEFVVWVLVHVFDKSSGEATRLMLQVHQQGAACAGVYAREIAETKCRETLELAEAQGMPLLVTVEPESDGGEGDRRS